LDNILGVSFSKLFLQISLKRKLNLLSCLFKRRYSQWGQKRSCLCLSLCFWGDLPVYRRVTGNNRF